MAHGADPNRPTPLMWKAISSSYPEAVEELERHGARPSKVNFLSTAVRGGSIEMVRHLVDGGAPLNPSAGEESEWTVLHQAVRLGKDDIVAFLLERGADPTIRDDQLHQTPLETTEANGRPTAADLLRNALKGRHT
jgi:ankyrin repeat protein